MLPLILAIAVVGTGAFDPYTPSAYGTSVCPGASVIEGVDVSKYEGSVDWPTVKAAGIGFGIARISDGLNFPDATFDTNYAAMKAQGLVRGSYQYFEPAQDANAQVNLVLQHIGTLGPGDVAPALDVETYGGLSASAVIAQMKIWLNAVQSATGRRPMIYTSPSFWDELGDPTLAGDLWIAHWGVSCPSIPAAWSGWGFWQYTATGTIAGVPTTGATDRDRFNGSWPQLLAYADVPAPAASITAPAANATLSGTVTVTATGNANLEIDVDGAAIGSGASVSWDTTTAADGAHTLTAKASDAYGQVATSAPVSVTVDNSTSGCSIVNCPPPVGCSTPGAGWSLLAGLLALGYSRKRT